MGTSIVQADLIEGDSGLYSRYWISKRLEGLGDRYVPTLLNPGMASVLGGVSVRIVRSVVRSAALESLKRARQYQRCDGQHVRRFHLLNAGSGCGNPRSFHLLKHLESPVHFVRRSRDAGVLPSRLSNR